MPEYLDYSEVRAAQKAAREAAEAAPATPVTPVTPPETSQVETPATPEPAEPTVTPSEEVVPETEDTPSETEDPEAETGETHRNPGAEKRISKLVKQRETERREKERLAAEVAYYKGLFDGKQGNTPVPPSQTPQSAETITPASVPDPSQFTDLVDYKVALALYNRDQQVKSQSVAAKIQNAYTKYPDLKEIQEEVMAEGGDIHLGPTATQALTESDIPDELLNYMWRHPDEARSLANMTPIQAAKTIGRIEDKLRPQTSPAGKLVAPKSKAPAPVTPVKPQSVSSSTKKSKYEAY